MSEDNCCCFCTICLYGGLALLVIVIAYVAPIVRFILQIRKKVSYKEPDLSRKFNKAELPEGEIDFIIIGTGLGSLVTGALLAKQGKKVVLLEQHTVAGGSCHSFKEKGYCFESGFHYIGNQKDYLDILGLALSKDIEWNTIRDYDFLKFGDQPPFIFSSPESQLVSNLKKEFPQDSNKIDRYVALAKRAFKSTQYLTLANFWLSGFILRLATTFISYIFRDVYKKTSLEVCKELGIAQNQKLMSILFGQFVNYGLPPSKSPFVVGSGTPLTHFVNGAIYPKQKPEAIIKSIVSTIEQCGGRVFVNCAVEKILIGKGSKASGVVIKNDVIISAKNVVSGAGLAETVQLLPDKYKWKIPNLKPGVSHFVAFVGINDDIQAPANNLWYFPCSQDSVLEDEVNAYKKTLDLDKMYLFISFPTGKAGNSGEGGASEESKIKKTSCIMLAEATWEMVEKYKETTVKRKEGYKEFKAKILAHMLKKLQELYPKTKDKIEFAELGTPLSIEHFLGRFASCGCALDTERFLNPEIGPKTPVKGLFITGQDSFYPGICGAIVSGFFCALQINRLFN